jgi:signal transduction histidine kinase
LKDERKTKKQLIGELEEVRRRAAELAASEAACKRAEGTLKRRLEQLTAIGQVSQAVTASLEPDQVLAEILSLACEAAGADYAGVVLVDDAGNIGQSAQNLPGVPAREYRVRDRGFTSWVIRSRQAVVIDEIGEDGSIDPCPGEGAPRTANPFVVQAGVKSAAGLPLMVKDRVLGVLYLHSLRTGAFRDQLPVLTALADQVATAIENARLHRELQAYAHRLEQRVQERTAQLQGQYARLGAILSSASDGIIVADARGEIIQANPIANTWLTQTLSPEDAARLREVVRNLAMQPEKRPEAVLALTGLDLELRAAPIKEPGGEGAAVVIAVHDVSHLRALDRMRSQFVSNVSRELRTPVTIVKLYAMLMRQAPPERLNDYLEVLMQEADRQARLVNDILQISRIDAGRVELELQSTPLSGLVNAIVISHQALAQERGLTLEYRPAEPEPLALVDPDRVMQVVVNLLMNAIQFTPKGGKVVVSTGREKAEGRVWATVAVADTGIGIPEQELPHIFERFFRGEQPQRMQLSATGLGLAIAKEIVELHGGQVTVESQVDVGSTFTVWLPLADQAGQGP